MHRRAAVVAVMVVGASILAGANRAAAVPGAPGRTVWDSVYSTAQAARGETAYVKSCARCHRESLAGADESPPLAGSGFVGNWSGQTLAALHDRIRTGMPPDSAGTLARPVVTDVIAYILKVNGFPAGAVDLSTETDSLKSIALQANKP